MIVRSLAVILALSLAACQSSPSGGPGGGEVANAPEAPTDQCAGLRTQSTIGNVANIRVSLPGGTITDCRTQADVAARQLAQSRLCDPQGRAARLSVGTNPSLRGDTLVYLYECA